MAWRPSSKDMVREIFDQAFLAHPRSVGQGYFQHMRFACTFGSRMIRGGVAAMLHGLAPWLFCGTASGVVRALNAELEAYRAQTDENDTKN